MILCQGILILSGNHIKLCTRDRVSLSLTLSLPLSLSLSYSHSLDYSRLCVGDWVASLCIVNWEILNSGKSTGQSLLARTEPLLLLQRELHLLIFLLTSCRMQLSLSVVFLRPANFRNLIQRGRVEANTSCTFNCWLFDYSNLSLSLICQLVISQKIGIIFPPALCWQLNYLPPVVLPHYRGSFKVKLLNLESMTVGCGELLRWRGDIIKGLLTHNRPRYVQ